MSLCALHYSICYTMSLCALSGLQVNLDDVLATEDELADVEWEGHVLGDVWQVKGQCRDKEEHYLCMLFKRYCHDIVHS